MDRKLISGISQLGSEKFILLKKLKKNILAKKSGLYSPTFVTDAGKTRLFTGINL